MKPNALESERIGIDPTVQWWDVLGLLSKQCVPFVYFVCFVVHADCVNAIKEILP